MIGPAELEKMEKFYRYLDVDGDGVTARTLPGEDSRGAYFVRGSGHNRYGGYTEDSAEYQDVMERLAGEVGNDPPVGARRRAAPGSPVHGPGPAGVRFLRRGRERGHGRAGRRRVRTWIIFA